MTSASPYTCRAFCAHLAARFDVALGSATSIGVLCLYVVIFGMSVGSLVLLTETAHLRSTRSFVFIVVVISTLAHATVTTVGDFLVHRKILKRVVVNEPLPCVPECSGLPLANLFYNLTDIGSYLVAGGVVGSYLTDSKEAIGSTVGVCFLTLFSLAHAYRWYKIVQNELKMRTESRDPTYARTA